MRVAWLVRSAVILGVLALAATVGLVVLAAREPTSPPLLADRLRALLAYQEDGHHLPLPPGQRNLRRVVEAAVALDRIDALDDAHLAQTLDEIESSWRPALQAFVTDDGADAYGTDDESRASYYVDLLELNVSVTEFVEQTQDRSANSALPKPDLGRLVDQLGPDPGPRARVLRARAARLSGDTRAFGLPDVCEQIVDHAQAGDIDVAADLARSLPSTQDCLAQVEALSGHLAVLESSIVSRITKERRASVDEIVALDNVRTLSEAAGQSEPTEDSVRVAAMMLQGLDDDARDYGPATETWVVAVLGVLLGSAEPPRLAHLRGRLNALIDFRGSLATSASADWYSRTLMAHLMVLSGALPADQAAQLFGHPSADPSHPGGPDWVLAFVGLRSRATAGLTLPRSVLTVGEESEPVTLLIRALYAADSGSCTDAPDYRSFETVSSARPVQEMPPDQRLGYVLALALSAPCSTDLDELLRGLADKIGPPAEAPDPTVRGSLSLYHIEAEAACLLHNTISLAPEVAARLDSYIRDISHGTVTQNFDFLDIYAALRLVTMHKSKACNGSWWEGL